MGLGGDLVDRGGTRTWSRNGGQDVIYEIKTIKDK